MHVGISIIIALSVYAQMRKDEEDDPANPPDYNVHLDYSYGLFVTAIGPVLFALALVTKLQPLPEQVKDCGVVEAVV